MDKQLERKMNTLTTALGTALILGSSLVAAETNAAQFVAADDNVGTQACMAIASNKPLNVMQTQCVIYAYQQTCNWQKSYSVMK